MEAGKAMGDVAGRRTDRGRMRAFGPLNPMRAAWWLFTNVRFAIMLLAALSVVSLLGVLVPQVPANMRGDAVAEAAWLQVQEGRYGILTDPMDRLGLFDVFHAKWFGVLMVMTAVSAGAYVVSRAPGVWYSITRPRRRVTDRYFEVAPNRLHVDAAVDVTRLERVLGRARYHVERSEENGATYLFADRHKWARAGTLLTHAAVIVFILSAAVSRVDAYSAPLFLAEGGTQPVLPAGDRGQMQVQLADARASFAADGRPLDYRSELAIFERGELVKRCQTTVNSPCAYRGYHFYQSAYFGYGAEVQVRNLSSGNVVYLETIALSETWPSPRVVIRGAEGEMLLDDAVVLTDYLETEGIAYNGTLVELAGGRRLTVGLRTAGGDEKLVVFEPADGPDAVRLLLSEGETAESGGLTITYERLVNVPADLVTDFPLPGGNGQVFLQMSNVVYGSGRASGGTAVDPPAGEGPPRLTITGLGRQAAGLAPGESVTIGSLEYMFQGQREFAGITAKRDRSDTLVWVGAALTVIGLMATFWVPRRRFWAKISATGTWFAGQAASHADYNRELRRMAREAGADVPRRVEDDD